MQKETLETFSGFCKTQKVSSMINESQIIVLLRLVNDILYNQDHESMKSMFTKFQEVVDPLLGYIKDQYSPQVKLYAIECIRTLGFRARPWITDMLSLFLSLTNITNADLQSLKQVPIYMNILVSNSGAQVVSGLSSQSQQLNDQL